MNLMKTIKILGGFDKVVQEKWWGYVRDLLGLRSSTSLSNRLMMKYSMYSEYSKYSEYNKRKRTTGSQTIQNRKKKRKTKFPTIPPIPTTPTIPNNMSFLTMAAQYLNSLYH